MKKKFFKLTSLAIVLLMAVALFSACDNGTDSGKNTGSNKSQKAEKPTSISIFVDTTFLVEELGQDKLVEEYKKKTGVELKIEQPAHNQYYDVLNTKYASGQIPDITEISETNYLRYASQGAFAKLDKLIDASESMKSFNKKILDAVKVNGKICGIPIDTGGGCLTYIRQDWLNNLGLKAPTTYDEFVDVMKAFTEKDPDKNGKNDTYGFTAVLFAENKLQEQYLRDFYQNSSPDFILKNKKWIDGFVQPEFKKGLERLKKAMDSKFVDLEILTNTTANARDKFTRDKAGMFAYWNNTWAKTLSENAKRTNPKAEIVPIPAIKESYNLNRVPVVHALSSKSKNPEGIFKYFLEYIHDGAEGQNLFTYGVEGVHWKQENGQYAILPKLNDPKVLNDKVVISPVNLANKWVSDPPFKVDEKIIKAQEAFNKNFKQMDLQPASDAFNVTGSDLNKYKGELVSKYLKGELTYANMIKEYNNRAKSNYNIEGILSEYNKNN